ncbi:hypothetical protein MB02_01100 [Croceicoccus estronivorus]|uniref:phage terminase small subunit n=1 Tax=Croceicoccus estronivorus TaxID=1172626 RepID=UPI000835216C|nr:phage terminase small subunit [Croceicoccus estronivorus]OCC25301.1 hypothetical protein MB02_01100 [Croceicoccus estronivorus]
MRQSPAARFKQATLARIAIESASSAGIAPERPDTGAEATEYELLLAALGEDMRRLKDIQSTEGKIAAKREMIDRFSPHVDATLAAAIDSGRAVQDEVLVNMMIWRFDIADYDRALDIAEHVLRFGLRLPERFQRTPATLIAEEAAEAGLTAAKMDRDFPLAVLQRADQLTATSDMPDIVRAKLAKAQGQQLQRAAAVADDDPETTPAGAAHASRKAALVQFRRAIELEPKIGVVKEIERLTAWLNKHAPPDPATQDEQPPQ